MYLSLLAVVFSFQTFDVVLSLRVTNGWPQTITHKQQSFPYKHMDGELKEAYGNGLNMGWHVCANHWAVKRYRVSLGMGLLDKLKEAFENDPTMSADKSSGQLEDSIMAEDSNYITPQRTEVQRRWLNSQQAVNGSAKSVGIGAPIRSDMLVGTKWVVDLYLAGVPDRDPSNNLFGAKTNISSRDKSLGLGVECPAEASISVMIELDECGVCRADRTGFTTGVDGKWKMSSTNDKIAKPMLRFSLDTTGYCRTVQTTGTITKVFWSDENEVSTRTSSTYSIPAGYVYGDAVVGYGTVPGTYVLMPESGTSGRGILRAERKVGVLGVSSKLVACGKFVARMVTDKIDQ